MKRGLAYWRSLGCCLLVGGVLAACGTADTTPQTNVDSGSSATIIPTMIPTAIMPTAITISPPNAATNVPSTLAPAPPTAMLPDGELAWTVVKAGDPAVGTESSALAVALRGSDQTTLPAELPTEATTILRSELAANPTALYLVVYGGMQPSGGYRVDIEAIVPQADNTLLVRYRISGPPAGQGAASVITYPYIIVRVTNTAVAAADVLFAAQP